MLSDILPLAMQHLNPRAHYARDVLSGYQRWSGADIKGKARRFGAGYARQRSKAASALLKAGGCIVAERRTGRLRTAALLCVDDYGTEIYDVQGLGTVPADQLRK